jgi:membrane protein DedA with SNARE-associated domain
MTDQLLAALSVYGLPVLFAVILIASIGLPFPVSLLLVAAGSFVEQGEMELISVIAVATAAAVMGDNLAYLLARWGGAPFILRISRGVGGEAKVKKAEGFSKRWGGTGIFFSRWLVTALGPWINVTSGIARYPWRRFLVWDVFGELLWVVVYVGLGYTFSDRVQTIAELLGNLAWAIVGLVAASILGWKLLQYFRREDPPSETTGISATISRA